MRTLLFFDLRCGLRTAGGPGVAIAVFSLALVLFPLLMGPEADILRRVGPGLMWLMAAIASLLYSPSLIQEDIDDGTLIQLRLVPTSTTTIFLSKALSHFLLVGIPITVLSLTSSLLYDLSMQQTLALALTFVIGLPAISCLSLLGSALCSGARGGNLLTMLLTLPLMLPLFIFALSAVEAIGMSLTVSTHLTVLAGLSILGCVLATSAGQLVLKWVD